MRTSPKLFLFLVLPAFLMLSQSLAAQDLDNVTISGKVTDQNGAIIPGATVTATLIATKVERTVVTDDNGSYRLIQLSPGVYSVKASFTNFAAEEKTNLTTIAAQNVRLDFTLQPAAVSASAVVVSVAEAAEVDPTRTIVGGTVTTREIELLPVASRSPIDLIFHHGRGGRRAPIGARSGYRSLSPNHARRSGKFFDLGGHRIFEQHHD